MAGGGVYIEGNDFLEDHQQSGLAALLGAGLEHPGYPQSIGNVDAVEGSGTSFAEGLVFACRYRTAADESNDSIRPLPGTNVLFRSSDGAVRGVTKDLENNGGRMLYTSFLFCSLLSADTDERAWLIQKYVLYLTGPEA